MLDPRPSVISSRFSRVSRVIAVTGWKGGIGKSVTASALALLLAKKGFKTGLLDLDFSGASAHLILGAKGLFPKEEKGIEPPSVGALKFMSVVFFSESKAVPLRGAEISQAILELLAITQWGELDFLIIDMPPGINDAALDVIRFIKKAEVLAVTTPSVIARDVLRRSLELYKKLKVPVLGVVENRTATGSPLGAGLGYDAGLEKALGSAEKILKTGFCRDIQKKVLPLLRLPAGGRE